MDSASLYALDSRISAIEGKLRIWKQVCALLCLFIVLIFILGQSLPESKPTVFDSIAAKTIVVTESIAIGDEKGRIRVMLSKGDDDVALRFYDTNGRKCIQISANDQNGYVIACGPDLGSSTTPVGIKTPNASLGYNSHGAMLRLRGPAAEANILANSDALLNLETDVADCMLSSSNLLLSTPRDDEPSRESSNFGPFISLRLEPVKRVAEMLFFDSNSKGGGRLGVDSNGAAITLFDKSGGERATLGATSVTDSKSGNQEARSEASLLLFGLDGKVLWRIP